MADYLRKNAWNNGGTFENQDLLWYAIGVGIMQTRALDQKNSWWFFGAIHGQYIDLNFYPGWSFIQSPPSVPVSPKPDQSTEDEFWNQCQHQSWYFLPWHRGYLIALEEQIRSAISTIEGSPQDWALPFWNYFGANQSDMPPAFTQRELPELNDLNLPDNFPKANPLFVNERYGANDIIIGNDPANPLDLSEDCQNIDFFTGRGFDSGYGGFRTGFWHGGEFDSGGLESNPHNLVHSVIGGSSGASGHNGGLMSYPGTAALDPIFYLHHCNIDRFWAAWNTFGNSNPTEANWLNGPESIGERPFVMPLSDGSTWNFKPKDIENNDDLTYSYEGAIEGIIRPVDFMAVRMMKLGIPNDENIPLSRNLEVEPNIELVGSSSGSHNLINAGLKTNVKLDNISWQNVPISLRTASINKLPDRVFLRIENVTGINDANILNIKINDLLAKQVSLFGLFDASISSGHQGGSGLTFTVEVTDFVDDLFINDILDIENIEIDISTVNKLRDEEVIKIGNISLYRESL